MGKVLCFGETLLRMVPTMPLTWINESYMKVFIAGAELNVARALGLWQHPVSYFTALPDQPMSQDILQDMTKYGIDASSIVLSEGRLGLYFIPQGVDIKSGVVYDRVGSSFYRLRLEDIDFDRIFEDVSWLHISTITPAISQDLADISLRVLKHAADRGIKISIDLNYRSKLWQYGVSPKTVVPQMMEYCHVVMGNVWAVDTMLPINLDQNAIAASDYKSASLYSMEALLSTYPQLETIAFTYRFDKPYGINYFGHMWHNHAFTTSEDYQLHHVVDRVGSGDCFMAALIFGLSMNWANKAVIDTCCKAALTKLGEEGDHTRTSIHLIKESNFVTS